MRIAGNGKNGERKNRMARLPLSCSSRPLCHLFLFFHFLTFPFFCSFYSEGASAGKRAFSQSISNLDFGPNFLTCATDGL